MRKLYVLNDEEFDDEFEAEKYDESDGFIDNPTCPQCGRELLLAYVTEGELEVITWYCLMGDEQAESWWLVCGNFNCNYEEEVELANKPQGATLMDLSDVSSSFSSETGYDEMNPSGELEMMQHLQTLHAAVPNRKLPSLIDGLQWSYDQHMEQIKEWLAKVPSDRKIDVSHGADKVVGYLVSYSDTQMVVRREDSEETVALPLDECPFYGPKYFRDEPEEPKEPEEKNHFIMVCSMERCVVKGHHLHLDNVDRFGRHHVRTWDPAIGQALGMKPLSETCYEGVFRRNDVEGKYHLRKLVKVGGYWVEWMGPTENNEITAVKTEDLEVAKALGFKPWKPWCPNEDGSWPPPPFFYGYVTQEQIQEQEEHPVWYWPFPEAKGVDR